MSGSDSTPIAALRCERRQRRAEHDRLRHFEGGLDASLEPLLRIACRAFGAPAGQVLVPIDGCPYPLARFGPAFSSTPNDDSDARRLFRYALRGEAPLVVADLHRDPRFASAAVDDAPPGVRFFAGAPLRTAAGARLGVLCVTDGAAHAPADAAPDASAVELLGDLAAVAVELLERSCARRELGVARQHLTALTAQLPALVWTTDRDLRITSLRGSGNAGSGNAPEPGIAVAAWLADAAGADAALAAHRAALRGAEGDYEIELGGVQQQAHVEPLAGAGGAIVGCLGVAVDISAQRAAERAQIVTDATYRELLTLASDAILVTNREGIIEIANARAHELFGYLPGALIGFDYAALVDPDDLASHPLRYVQLRSTGSLVRGRTFRRYDGSVFYGEVSARLMPDDRFQGIVRDVTERRRSDERLRRNAAFRSGLIELVRETLESEPGQREHLFQRILDLGVATIPGAEAGSVLIREGPERFRFVAAHGYDAEGLRDVWLETSELEWDPTLAQPQILPGFRADRLPDSERRDTLWTAGSAAGIRACLILPVHLDGRFLAYLLFDNHQRSDAFAPDAVEMGEVLAQQLAALLARRTLEERLRTLAYVDPLTGLANRARFTRELDARLATVADPFGAPDAGAPSAAAVALIFLDLDDFGTVNDLHGHEVGDALLEAVATRLVEALPGHVDATVGRWGGDEFLVMLPAVDAPRVELLAARLAAAFAAPFEIGARRLYVRASLGWELGQRGRIDAAELIRRADTALLQVKRQGRGGIRRFDADMQRRLGVRRGLEDDLRSALAEGALEQHYQPRVELASGRVTSVEALARWTHPARGPVSPSEFIPLAEANGTIVELGRQALDAACAQAARWRDAGTPLRTAVNVSALQLADPGFVELVRSRLALHRLPPELLELEITESVAMGAVQGGSGVLERLHQLGIAISIDDFGTAYSSLARLRDLPVRSLKIDRSFVTGLGDDGSDDAQVARAVVSLARSLGLATIAEGIETEAQKRLLVRLGCDEGQGWLFARALPAAELEAWLRAR